MLTPFFQLRTVHDKPRDTRDRFGQRKSEPCAVESDERECPKYRDKAEYLTEKGKERALRALADRLKEGGHDDSEYRGNESRTDYRKGDFPDFDDLRAVGKQADHRNGEENKADDAEQHEHRRYKEGQIHRLTAALSVALCKVEAEDRHDARLKSEKRNEEKAL